ncbi:MAG: Fis family transcriptional regulator [Gammaproteobacteria bacterium HGW-Gammaproteobacteria-10]|nr:MAG: Fis family transcriptional regulator [Gammaproteobacteria bacterium HGW-Gammaproteobacteria-10]
MNETSFSDLTPTFFLQTFVLELMHAAEQQGKTHSEELIEYIARTAGRFFEETYREERNIDSALDTESYIELIVGLKTKIGGGFSLESVDSQCVRVKNSCCPFGEGVTHFPELCRMTSSVFGGIAARNFGYAKVEIAKSIARKDGGCDVSVYLNEEEAKGRPGLEYGHRNSEESASNMTDLHSRIEESMQKIWRMKSPRPTKKQPPVIVAKSPVMQRVLRAIEKIAPTVATVLIQGETGVGKELVARAIHAMSWRSGQAFMAINCGAIPDTLIESALFGHEKGAFTGAVEIQQGVFERADGGTLFLDEVDSLSAAAQTRLLRVVQEGELERVGGKKSIEVDVRLISATNQDLQERVERGLFRKDLFYRLNVVKLSIPPLTQRGEDLPYLVQVILKRLSEKYNKKVLSVSRGVMQKIRAYHWPGNVRELENVLERAVLFAVGSEITPLDLEMPSPEAVGDTWRDIKEGVVADAERNFLQASLRQHRGDVKKVAVAMDLTPRAVYGKLKKYGMDAGQFRVNPGSDVEG